ncbi:Hypothetical protein c1472 [Escherichia coli CFT073]|uniref:Uncharacterized protein n=1 Tax=Escherichia coli O6:H1 (strain CFT073 / ATCC 700928 / UPEC) TaxID=199310 RepID=A0A0H2V6N2_ECOL6|nr:Hypothetical protein c1472 [Escherichia coli CFT073]
MLRHNPNDYSLTGFTGHSISGAVDVSTRFSNTLHAFHAASNDVSSFVAYTAHLFHPRLTNSQTSRHATTGTAKSIRLATSHARGSKPPHHGMLIRLPCPNISIQRYSAWVCSRAMKNVQPAIAP